MYKIQNGSVLKLDTGSFIPEVPGNRDYQEYLDWVEAGNTPEPEFTLDERRLNAVARIKEEAAVRIDTIVPIHKQLNTISRALELTVKKVDGTITAQESDELAAAQAVWDNIKAIRQASNVAETEIVGSNNPESIVML